MRRIFLFLVLIFLAFPTLSQIFDGKDFHISVSPKISYSTGTLGEDLFYSKFYDDTKKISGLEWERKIFLFGADFDFQYKNLKWTLGASSSVFEQKSGEMRDSDWLNLDDYSMKTTYSVGTNSAVSNYELQTFFSYEFQTNSFISFSPVLGVQYFYDSFERRNAEGWYTDHKHWWYDETSTHYPYSYWSDEKGRYVTRKLAGIDLYRHSLYTWFGFNAKIKPFSRVSFDFEALLSPFAYFYAVDSHHAQNSSTKEMYKKHYRAIQFSKCNFLSLSASTTFRINSIFEVRLKGTYFFSFEIERGTLYKDYFEDVKQDKYYDTGQDSGITVENFTATLALKVKVR